MRPLAGLVLTLYLLVPTRADANPVCRWLGLCWYLSPGFDITVVDAETGKPLAGVYAWAEWVQYGHHGTNGPLMIQEATSGADGRLTFPWWGPRFGSPAGLDLGSDPAVILFKPGYATLLAQNAGEASTNHLASIRGFYLSGKTVRLQPFRGSLGEWMDQIRKLVFPGLSSRVSDAQRDQFRVQYLRRADLATAQLEKLPSGSAEVETLRSSLGLDIKFFRGVQR